MTLAATKERGRGEDKLLTVEILMRLWQAGRREGKKSKPIARSASYG
jgi:hypothetical protein